MSSKSPDGRSLKIIHVLRAPLGGLFRHVLDLTREQVARGHRVGLITDSLTGGERADRTLAELAPTLALGLTRTPMRRNPHISDIAVLAHVIRRIRDADPDIVHGHGSKGAFYARFPAYLGAGKRAARAYTPHGGSFNYNPGSPLHRLYMRVEGALNRATDIFLFESDFIASCFHAYVGSPHAMERVVLNGIGEGEFEPVRKGALLADFVYVGELRSAKGIDTLIDAIAEVGRQSQRTPRAVLVGSGPDAAHLAALARERGLADQISFAGVLPAREAFALGRVLVVPSRAESLPYVALEAAGARTPMIATNVGGIPEIFGPYADRLIPCNDAHALAQAMMRELGRPPAELAARAEELGAYVQGRFSIAQMADAVLAGYRDAIAARPDARRRRASAIAPATR
jgi:glycosyltransferase involved in cell wall biosynthesis